MSLYIPGAEPALKSPRTYTGSPVTIPTRATDILAPSWEGHTTVTGTPSPDNPATITGIPFAATATGPDGQTRSVDLSFTGYSLPDGTRDTYDGVCGDFVQRVGKLVLDGTENWSIGGAGVRDNVVDFSLMLSSNKIYFASQSEHCTHFHAYVDDDTAGVYIWGAKTGMDLFIPKTVLSGITANDCKAWLAAQAAAGTPVTVYYELAQPIAYNKKVDITAFDGETTVTGADVVEVIEGRVLRVADCLPFEIVRNNRNLFDNPYLTINQRGQFHSGNYMIGPDRWRINRISYDVEKEEITILDPTGDVQKIYQTYEAERTKSSVLTFSVLVGNNLYTLTTYNRHKLAVLDMDIGELLIHTINGGAQHFELRPCKLPVGTKLSKPYFKLEEGAEQTLARKIGDQWVLNDPPPDYGLELLKCQRYFLRQNYEGLETIGNSNAGTTWLNLSIALPVSMRLNAPRCTITCKPTRVVDNLVLPAIAQVRAKGAQANLGFSLIGDALASYIYAGQAGYIDFDANL